ncbi:hypothetical protein C0580_04465 [Candidatus Parcubacteria bacterium]|nr:MAG: hypothetical protein C0580_04465 [Candidatus Parcubacteria bacterium]
MKKIYLFEVFKSNYCKIVFLLIFIASYFLIPEKVFYGWFYFIAILFMISFSLVMTCLIRSIKDKVVENKQTKQKITGAIAALIGLSALQVCTVGAPVCGVSIGFSIVASIFPSVAFNFLEKYSVYIIVISILLQLYSLYKMACFHKMLGKCHK